MIVRYGLIHLIVIVGTLAVIAGLFWIIKWSSTKAFDSERGQKVIVFLSLALLIGIPVTVSLMGTTVWMIDNGSGGELAYRRYLLFGSRGIGKRLDESDIPFSIVPEENEIVVNATSGAIFIEDVQYGGIRFAHQPLRNERLEPGSFSGTMTVNQVGPPLEKTQVKEGSVSTYLTFVHK